MIMLKKIFIIFYSQIRSMFIIFIQIFKKRSTCLYPEKSVYLSPRYRGRIVLTKDSNGEERCVACNLCATVCPVDCIALEKSSDKNNRWYPKFFRINFSRCIFCGLCEEACPTQAIQLIPDFELAEFKRKDLIYEKEDLLISGTGKYSNYNFYNIAGVTIKSKKKDLDKDQYKPIDIKSLMP